MPIKSKAQRRKFAQLLVEGEITPETFEEWNRGAGSAELPERLHPKKKASGRSRKTRKKKATTRRAKPARSRAAAKKTSKTRRSTRAKRAAARRR